MRTYIIKHNKPFYFLVFLILILPISCILSSDSTPLKLDSELRTGKLANGFTYYIRKNKNPDNRLLVYFVVKAGSLLENEDQRGIAHFIEHMSFSGTKNFPGMALTDYLEKVGVQIGPDLNATTNPDETIYRLPLPGGSPQVLSNGLRIVRDWAQDLSFDSIAVEKERKVILEEKRYLQGLKQRTEEQLIPIYTNHSRYGQRLPIGTEKVIKNVKASQLKQFYHDWYRPNLQAIFIVGDINVQEVENEIKASFSSLKNPEKEKKRPSYGVELSGKDQYFHFQDEELGGIVLEIVKKSQRTPQLTTDDFRKRLTQKLLEQLILDRFRQLPFVTFNKLSGGLEAFRLSVNSEPAEIEPAFKSVWLEIKRMKEDGFLESEFKRIKKRCLQKVDEIVTQKDDINPEQLMTGYIQHFLNGDVKMDPATEAALTKNLLSNITLKDVNTLLGFYIAEGNRDFIIKSSPANSVFVPSEVTIKSWMEQTSAVPMEAYVDEHSDMPLLSKEPHSGKISKQFEDSNTGLTTLELSNGIKIIVKKTTLQTDEILFKGIAEGGASLSTDDDYLNAIHAADIIGRSGVGNWSASQLMKSIAGQKIQVTPFINDNYQGVEGYSTTDKLPETLSLIYGYITEPRKDRETFETLIGRTREEMRINVITASQLFSDSINYLISGRNIRRKVQTLKDIEHLNLDRAYQIYRDRFAHAAGLTFVFVGDINMDRFKPLVEKYLASLPNTGQRAYIRDLNMDITDGNFTHTIKYGKNQKASAKLIYSGKYDYNLLNNVRMKAAEECIKLMLTTRLRNQERGTYTPQVQLLTAKYPKSRFMLTISFDCAIENVQHLIRAAQEEVAKMRDEGPANSDLQKFKANRKLTLRSGSMTNSFWLEYLISQVTDREKLDQFDQYLSKLELLTADDVRDAARHFIQPQKNEMTFVLLPKN